MRAAEDAAFARGISAEALMDQAAAAIARCVRRFFPTCGRCVVFAGKGNNAGDAFAAAELLQRDGGLMDLRLAFADEQLGELARKKLNSLRNAPPTTETQAAQDAVVVLDGLLGLGAKPPLREPIRAAAREINRLRREEGAFVFALDIPTGLDGDSGKADADCVVADFTIAIGFAKRGLVADAALDFVGRLEVVDLTELSVDERSTAVAATAGSLRHLLPPRNF